jgi:hypothetical protein
MRFLLLALAMFLGSTQFAQAQVSVNFGSPGVNIGINFSAYPELVPVPGYPVYYAPRANSNYFFYDGLYWVYQGDNWYQSSWYNGPWQSVGPEYVPLYVLRVPVRYYRSPPVYFRGWSRDAPPRWGDHWGREWQTRHDGWDRWDRRAPYKAAPLPAYQRQYSGNRYPSAAPQQAEIRTRSYSYQPREAVSQQHYREHGRDEQRGPSQGRGDEQRGSPQGRGEDHRGGSQERGHDNRNDDRSPERR